MDRIQSWIGMKTKITFTRFVFIAVFIVITLLGGCASLGPAADPSGVNYLARKIDHNDGGISHHFKATWLPNEAGYTDLNKTFAGNRGDKLTEGFLVLTDAALYFIVWDRLAEEYSVLLRVSYDRLANVRLIQYGQGRRVTIQEKDTFRPNTFEITRGLIVDQEASELAVKFIDTKIKGIRGT